VIAIKIKSEAELAGHRDMNRIGTALICLIALQWIISTAVYCVIALRLGLHFYLNGFTPEALLKSLMQLKMGAANNPNSMPLALFAATLIANTVPFIICARACGVTKRPMFSRPRIDGGEAALFGVVSIGLGLLFSMFVSSLAGLLRLVHLRLSTPAFNIPWKSPFGAAAIIIAVVVIAPLTEEFICRGVLLRVFRRYGDVFAVIASSLVWALLHGNFVQGIPVFFMGIFLGMLALKSGSILPTFIIHAANNALALFESAAAQSGSNLPMFAANSLNIIILFAAIVLFSACYRQFNFDSKGRVAHGLDAFFTCPTILITIIFCAFLTVMSVRPL
jgi:membrane protease YdiL (CAAX protease family)